MSKKEKLRFAYGTPCALSLLLGLGASLLAFIARIQRISPEYRTYILDDAISIALAAFFWIGVPACCFGLLYFLPAIMAARKDSPQFQAIYLFTILIGWTGLGWLLTLIWAATDKTPPKSEVPAPTPLH